MQRSIGVTLSAVVVFISSSFALLCGLFVALPFFIQGVLLLPNMSSSTAHGIGAVIVTIVLAFAAWGFASGVGLIRLREGARVSTIAYGAFLILIGVLLMLGYLIPLIHGEIRSRQGVDFYLCMAVFYGFVATIGGFFLYFFNRCSVMGQFRAAQTAFISPPTSVAAARILSRPVPITILAWFFIVVGVLAPFSLLFHGPVPVFGYVLTGVRASGFSAMLSILGLAAAFGLFRLRPWGWSLAIYMTLFRLLSDLTTLLLPGAWARFEEAIRLSEAKRGMVLQPSAFTLFPLWLPVLFTCIYLLAFVWVLLAYRNAFRSP